MKHKAIKFETSRDLDWIHGPKSPDEEMKRYATIYNFLNDNTAQISEKNRKYLGEIYKRIYSGIRACDLSPEMRKIRSRLLVLTGVEGGILQLRVGGEE